ncbi:mevalonate kinase [Histomonas meleagridis]|uniref:mevalonate kinase n=1 Tax=Histomonas meleagridis TaxID=135588 RepID=UPI0035595BB7|nr:mevalonate kinase [Histomonas meleagridis]KAH0797493.1 mevalonate kinase [Histomonas meleagridis]
MLFKYSSPGKIILFGEHAVVYGYAAIATAVSKRMNMKCEVIKSTRSEINIFDEGELFSFNPFHETPASSNAREKMLRYAFKNGFPKNHTLNITIDGEFPTGTGLGSSAAFCSLIAAASNRVSNQSVSKESLFEKTKILENFFHHNASGLDPATVIYGGAIFMENRKFSHLSINKVPLLIIDTQIPRSTSEAVKHVASLLSDKQSIYKPMMESLGNISKQYYLEKPEKKNEFIYKYFPIAQNLLENFDLSCPKIDEIVQICKKNNLVCKISGAGMGGVVMVTGNNVEKKTNLFKSYNVISAEIGLEGIREEK